MVYLVFIKISKTLPAESVRKNLFFKTFYCNVFLLQIYFSTIKIVDGKKYSLITSDGLMALPENVELKDLEVADGIQCHSSEILFTIHKHC